MESPDRDTIAAHALHALPQDEADLFAEFVAGDPLLEDELDSYRRVSSGLIHGFPDIVPAPSPDLWDRISAEAGITTPEVTSQPSKRRFSRNTVTALAAAASLVAVLGVGAIALSSNTTSDDVRTLAAAAAESPGALSVTLSSPAGVEAIGAQVTITADGTGYIVADSLPALTADRTYQLWVIVDDRVISAALLGNDPGVAQFRAEGTVVGVAVSNEIAGGVAVSAVDPTAIWLSDSI